MTLSVRQDLIDLIKAPVRANEANSYARKASEAEASKGYQSDIDEPNHAQARVDKLGFKSQLKSQLNRTPEPSANPQGQAQNQAVSQQTPTGTNQALINHAITSKAEAFEVGSTDGASTKSNEGLITNQDIAPIIAPDQMLAIDLGSQLETLTPLFNAAQSTIISENELLTDAKSIDGASSLHQKQAHHYWRL